MWNLGALGQTAPGNPQKTLLVSERKWHYNTIGAYRVCSGSLWMKKRPPTPPSQSSQSQAKRRLKDELHEPDLTSSWDNNGTIVGSVWLLSEWESEKKRGQYLPLSALKGTEVRKIKRQGATYWWIKDGSQIWRKKCVKKLYCPSLYSSNIYPYIFNMLRYLYSCHWRISIFMISGKE